MKNVKEIEARKKRHLNRKTKAFLIGLIVRFALAPFTGHPWDVKIWIDVGKRVFAGQNVYDVGVKTNWYWGYYAYPPLWMIWCVFSYIFSANQYFMILVLKIPIIIADVFAAQAVYDVVLQRTKDEQKATKAFMFYFLNPFVILVGSIWGMFDAVPMILTFLSTIYLYNGRNTKSALALGLGIALKVYPAFLLPLYFFYMVYKRKEGFFDVLKYLLTCAAPTVVLSIPFLILNYKSYLTQILFHAGHIGQLSWWFLISHETYIAVEYGFILFILLYGVLYFKTLARVKDEKTDEFEGLNRGVLAILLAFFITSTKMNDHYLLWCVPNAIVDAFRLRDSKSKKLFIALIALDVIFILFLLPINNFFLIYYFYNSRDNIPLITGIAMALITLAPIFSYVCYLYLRYLLSKDGKIPKPSKKGTVITLSILSIFILLLAPFPSSVNTPSATQVIAVPESPAAGFTMNVMGMGIEEFDQKFQADTIVLMFGPDFVNTYKEYDGAAPVEEFFKVRFDEGWRQSNVRDLVSLLHDHNKRALIGVYFRAHYVYNYKGFRSNWLLDGHPEVLKDDIIIPYASLHEDEEYGVADGTKYYIYFTDSILKIVQNFDFDGVALFEMGNLNGEYTREEEEGYIEALDHISDQLHYRGKILVAEDFFGQNCLEIYTKIIPHTDFFIVQTQAWVHGFYFFNLQRIGNYYSNYVSSLLNSLPTEERSKILFALETMDEQEGWFTPYFFLTHEIGVYSSLGLSGYAIVHANKCCPFTLKRGQLKNT